MVFVFPREEEITKEVVEKFIAEHQLLVPLYQENYDMYLGLHEILTQEAKEMYKPDNRIVANYAKYTVDTTEGYFIGVPVKVTHKKASVDEAINQFRNRSNMADVESEVSKLAAIFGHAYIYMYQDELSDTYAVENTPLDMFIVYDDTIAQKPLFAVRYYYDDEQELRGELMTETHLYVLASNKDGITIGDEQPHYYGDVPVVEYVQNSETQAVFENVKTLINALNKALSEKANDLEYFADSYIKILGAELDEESLNSLRDNRIINFAGDGTDKLTVDFMTKPSADELQENLIDRLIDLIYQLSMTANMNDTAFAGNLSGVAMEFKLQGMKNMAIMKERKFQASMNRMYKMLFNLPTNVPASDKDEWQNIRYQFSRNIPRNLENEAETMAKMEGILSKETQISVSSLVDDVAEELERIEKENEPLPQYDFEMSEIDDG